MIYSLGDKQLNKDNLDFWVAPNAVVIGDVSLKKNASVLSVSYTHLRAHET